MAHKYKVIEGEGKEAKIKKTGVSIEFSVYEALAEIEKIDKFKKEKLAQVDVETAKINNVLSYHPHVGDLTPEELNGAWIVKQSKAMIEAIENKMKELESFREELATDLEEVKKQTGINW